MYYTEKICDKEDLDLNAWERQSELIFLNITTAERFNADLPPQQKRKERGGER